MLCSPSCNNILYTPDWPWMDTQWRLWFFYFLKADCKHVFPSLFFSFFLRRKLYSKTCNSAILLIKFQRTESSKPCHIFLISNPINFLIAYRTALLKSSIKTNKWLMEEEASKANVIQVNNYNKFHNLIMKFKWHLKLIAGLLIRVQMSGYSPRFSTKIIMAQLISVYCFLTADIWNDSTYSQSCGDLMGNAKANIRLVSKFLST